MAEIAEEVNYCTIHTDREASLNCIRCGRYMCTKCANHTPVGYVCDQCYRQQDNTFFKGTNTDNVIIFASCAVLTGLGAAIISGIGIPFFLLLLFGLPIGGAIGEVALRLTGRRRTRYAHWIGAGACAIGGLAGGILQMMQRFNSVIGDLPPEVQQAMGTSSAFQYALEMLPNNWGLLLFIAIAAFGVYSRYKMRI